MVVESSGFESLGARKTVKVMTEDQHIRLKCLEYVSGNTTHPFAIHRMIEAQMLFQFVRDGRIPVKTSAGADVFARELLEKALDQLLDEREKARQSADSSNYQTDDFNCSESLVRTFLRRLGFKRAKESGPP